MNYPKMILFDYGQTLLCEPDFDTLKGFKALCGYLTKNTYDLSPDSMHDFSQELYKLYAKDNVLEINERLALKVMCEYLDIGFSVSLKEAERIFWDNTSIGDIMPDADVLLDFLRTKGIRTGVISNICWSGEALKERLDRLLPNNSFEFVIVSSEYAVKKPHPLIFQIALRKAGLDAGDVWYCGDNTEADIAGSAGVGIYPIWYDNDTKKNPVSNVVHTEPNVSHTHIYQWRELIDMLS